MKERDRSLEIFNWTIYWNFKKSEDLNRIYLDRRSRYLPWSFPKKLGRGAGL